MRRQQDRVIMHGWKRHHLVEWGFLAMLLAICVVLTALQNRWTSSLGQAAARQQTVQLRPQAELFCRAFDAQLNDACALLRPRGDQIADLGREGAHRQCLARWQADNPRPIFRRLAVAVPEHGSVKLYLLDQRTAQLTQTEWPPEWAKLQGNLTRHATGQPPPIFEDPSGLLREYPVFGDQGPGEPDEPGEDEWAIMELDPDYLRQTWLPELRQTYLGTEQEGLNDVVVKTRGPSPLTIFATNGGDVPYREDSVSLPFNRKGRGGRVDADSDFDAFWTLSTWPRSRELAAAVSVARGHDFALACVLDGCLLLGGGLIVHYARRARRLGDARMQFVAAVSHELRTPLTVIRAAGQNLRRGIVRDQERIDKYADVIVEHSDQLNDMVEQVLAFAGARRNEPLLVREPVAINQVVQEAVAACSLDPLTARCVVQTTVEGNPPPVLGDAQALRRVFQNLLGNAAKHGARGRWIGVHIRYRNGSSPRCVEVEVSDRGEGIPAREQPRVFEPFFRGQRAREQQTRGSGIGLSVVQEIVKFHGGNVRVASEPGKGTVFTVSLPPAEIVEST